MVAICIAFAMLGFYTKVLTVAAIEIFALLLVFVNKYVNDKTM